MLFRSVELPSSTGLPAATKVGVTGAATMVAVTGTAEELIPMGLVAMQLRLTVPVAAGVKVMLLVPAPAVMVAPVGVQVKVMPGWAITLAVAPGREAVTKALREMTGLVGRPTTVTVVLAVFLASSTEVAVMVALPAVAGAVQTPPLVMAPAVVDQVTPLVAPPVTVLLKVVGVETATVGAAGLSAPTAIV